MITRVKGSVFSFKDNAGYISLADPQIGGIGDGITDNTTAFNLALSFNIPVFIPSGTFLIGGIIAPANAVIFGEGSFSILKLKTAANVKMLQLSGTISVSNLTLNCNKAGQLGSSLHGITLNNCINSQIASVNVLNALGDGINITGTSTSGVTISNSFISGSIKNGITVESGTNINIDTVTTLSSDIVASPGDGISLAPASAIVSVSEVCINNCVSKNNIGRGVSILGFGIKNVSEVTINGGDFSSNTSHGIHAFIAQNVLINGSIVKGNSQDGIRFEGDVQFSRVSECAIVNNNGTCVREVTTGTVPNNNGFIYNAINGNGSNTPIKLGASSFIV